MLVKVFKWGLAIKNFKKLICHLCADTGTVPLAYIKGRCSANDAFTKVPCPKCTKEKPTDKGLFEKLFDKKEAK